MSYAELPVTIVYKKSISFGKVYAGAGAVYGFLLGGKQEQAGISKRLFSGEENNWRRSDAGILLTAGFQFNNGMFISMSSQKGMVDIYKPKELSIKNRSVNVSVGFLID